MSAQTIMSSPELMHGDDLRRLSVIGLVGQIAEDGNRAALREFHDHRSVFRIEDGWVCCAPYINGLLENARSATRWSRMDDLALEKAYDMTIDKFLNVPAVSTAGNGKTSQTDCRFYFAAYLRHAQQKLALRPGLGAVEQEMEAACLLQHFVRRHFLLSCLECSRRARKLERRYAYHTRNGILHLWLPSELPGSRAKAWLDSNVDDPDASRPGERDRVQQIIRDRLVFPRLLSLTRADGRDRDIPQDEPLLSWSYWHGVSVEGLAATVATEKVRNIGLQRRRIREQGEATLRRMIERIFIAVVSEDLRDCDIANEFGLYKSTYSRFGGRDWAKTIPDLWANLAELLGGHPVFIEAAKAAGVWEAVQRVNKRRDKKVNKNGT